MTELDLERFDPAGMLATVEASGDQWASALANAAEVDDPRFARVRSVIVCGMGGSGIAADVAQLVAFHHGTGIPVVPVKGYTLPAWIGPQTLFIAVSYSGETEETLTCLEQARQARCQIAVVTSGGKLGRLADERGYPSVAVPGGGQPRANLPNLVAPVIGLLEGARIVSGVLKQIAAVPGHVREAAARWSHQVPAEDNEVRQLAASLDGLVPIFYGGEGFPALVAMRAKCQVNENAKRPAFHNQLPELDHNEVVGWQQIPQVTARCGLVAIRDRHEHPQVASRFEVTLDLVGVGFSTVARHDLEGDNAVLRFARGVLFVDLLSVHLALRDEVDPTPVDRITELKRRIA